MIQRSALCDQSIEVQLLQLYGRDSLGTTLTNRRCTSAINDLTLSGGRAQKTRQCRQSVKPGSRDGSSSLARISSTLTPGKSRASSLARCWALRFVRWVS